MRNECFLDTNVLIYAAVGREDEPVKYAAAKKIIADTEFCLSAQVLAEFYVNVLRKPRIPPSLAEVDRWIEFLEGFPVAPLDATLVRAGIYHSRRHRIAYWDGAIIAAAEMLGAETLYTEDLNHGQLYGSVRVVNPFLDG